jgi:hypothetical protein
VKNIGQFVKTGFRPLTSWAAGVGALSMPLQQMVDDTRLVHRIALIRSLFRCLRVCVQGAALEMRCRFFLSSSFFFFFEPSSIHIRD